MNIPVEHRDDDLYIRNELYNGLKNRVQRCDEQDEDLLIVIDGDEGVGKSHTARQLGCILSKERGKQFTHNDIYHDVKQYIHDITEQNGSNVKVFDESRDVVGSTNAMTKKSKKFMNFLSENRDYNIIQIIVLPAFHDLNKYVVLWRMDFLIHMYAKVDEDGKLQRGKSRVYKRAAEKYNVSGSRGDLLFAYERSGYKYPPFKSDTFICNARWNSVEALTDEGLEEYESQKREKIKEKYDMIAQEKKDIGNKMEAAVYWYLKAREESPKQVQELCEDCPVTQKTMNTWRNRVEKYA